MADYEYEATPTLSNGVLSWNLCVTKPKDQAGCGSAPNYPGVQVAKGHLNQNFQFKIVNDNTGLGIQFAPSPPPPNNVGPLWVQANTKPTGPGLNGQIQNANGTGNSNHVLTFVDQNGNQGTLVLKYQLNFVTNQGAAVTAIDPDITNGGKTFYGTYEAVIAAVAAAFAVVLIIWLWRAKSRAAERQPEGDRNSRR